MKKANRMSATCTNIGDIPLSGARLSDEHLRLVGGALGMGGGGGIGGGLGNGTGTSVKTNPGSVVNPGETDGATDWKTD